MCDVLSVVQRKPFVLMSSVLNACVMQIVWDLDRAYCCSAGTGTTDCSTCTSQPFTTTIERTCSALLPSIAGYAVTTDQCSPQEICRNNCPAKVGTPNKPVEICVTAQQMVPNTLDEALWIKSYGTSPVNDSCPVCFMLKPETRPSFVGGYTSSAPGPSNVGFWEIAVGKTLILTLVAMDSSGDDTDIVLLPSPGAPNGAQLSAQVPYSVDGSTGVSRFFSFTPTESQVGMRFLVSFEPRSHPNPSIMGNRIDYIIQVATTQVLWNVRTLSGQCPWPEVDGVCLPEGAQEVTMGCSYVYTLTANLDCSLNLGLTGCSYSSSYSISLRMKLLPSCDGCGTAPIAVLACSEAETKGNSDATGSSSSCCGDGVCNGYETGSNCPQDCPPDGFDMPTCVPDKTCGADAASTGGCCLQPTQLTPDSDTIYQAQALTAVVVWTPSRQHQGRQVLNCIEAYDEEMDATYAIGTLVVRQSRPKDTPTAAPSLCVLYEVASCRYCVPYKATLRSIARHYLSDMDWLRLYNANPAIHDPSKVIAQQSIFLGPNYQVKKGDTLLGIAGAFHSAHAPVTAVNLQVCLKFNQASCSDADCTMIVFFVYS